MYYPQAPKEPNGCFQTLMITRVILSILFVPMLIAVGAMIGILLTFYALTIHPLLAVLTIAIGGGIIYAIAKWESMRVNSEIPDDDDA